MSNVKGHGVVESQAIVAYYHILLIYNGESNSVRNVGAAHAESTASPTTSINGKSGQWQKVLYIYTRLVSSLFVFNGLISYLSGNQST